MFKLPLKLKEDIKDYTRKLKNHISGKINSDKFKGIRVPWGFYSHRGGEEYMSRVRVPAQVISGSQLRAMARCSKKYAAGTPHVTTRGDIQIHGVDLEDSSEILEFLKENNLSSRGGGGNTVRNILCSPLAGVSPDEEFDVRKYPVGLTEKLLADKKSYTMPRKYKIAFSGSGKDSGLATVNDLGFIAKIKDGEEGFKVYVGGGMGSKSRTGDVLEEFVNPSEVPYIAQAVKRVFYKYGNRKNRNRARLRFLIRRIGLKDFKELYEKEIKKLKSKENIGLRDVKNKTVTSVGEEPVPRGDKEFQEFKKLPLRRFMWVISLEA